MGVPVLILGPSGSGKTYSMRNMPVNSYGLIECEKTMLPFRGGKKFARTKEFAALRGIIKQYADVYKTVVVDDFGYCVTDLFIKHIGDKDQYSIYKNIAAEVYNTVEFINELPGDVIVYITMHTDSDAFNNIIPKLMGKMVNETIDLLGMVNVCVLSEVIEGEHVAVVLIRVACADNKEFIDYAPISKAECDALLYAEEPDKYEWLNSSLYGGALKEHKRQCA